MQAPRQATMVRIYLNESAQWRGQPLSLALLDRLRKGGAAGATVFRGVSGFGVQQKLRTTAIEVLSVNLPLVLEWIDAPERVERLLPEISAMVGEGLVTVQSITVVKYAPREPSRVPEDRTVAEVMTREVKMVHPEAPLRELVELLINRTYRALPVVDVDGRLVGIVSNGDLIERGGLRLRAELLPTLAPEALEDELRRLEDSGRTAADIMTRDVVTVRPETNLEATARLMATNRLKRLPVVDADRHVVGIVSRVDILRSLATQYPPVAGQQATEPGRADTVEAEHEEAGTVGGVMSRRIPAVGAEAALTEVLEAVVSTRLNRAVVVDVEQRPIGVITDAELMRRLGPRHHAGLAQSLMRKLPFTRLSPEEQEALRAEQGKRAADLMLTPVVTVRETTPITEAAQQMLERRYKILPVVDGDGRLVGLIDRADLLRAMVT